MPTLPKQHHLLRFASLFKWTVYLETYFQIWRIGPTSQSIGCGNPPCSRSTCSFKNPNQFTVSMPHASRNDKWW